MESNIILFALQHDFFVLVPIFICSILLLGVAIDRILYYNQNKRDIIGFIQRLQRELQRGQLDSAQVVSNQLGGVIGDVAEEGLRIVEEQPENFDRSYDITASLARRKLEARLSIIGTIATISPYLGLFATVVRILLTFGEMAQAQSTNAAPQIMFGIGSALIATAIGLFIAIAAVTLNNWFQSIVNRFEDDFQLIKLLLISYAEHRTSAKQSVGASPAGAY
jgi:biopolymer transport protein ExbB